MARLSRAEVAHRLGLDPSQWTFSGQCYAAVEGHTRVCAITLREPTACFTIKPKSGPGRKTVSPEAFLYFRHTNPDLFIKLQTGLSWLRLRTQDVEAAKLEQQGVERLRAAQKKHHTALMAAKKRIKAYRRLVPEGELPEELETLSGLILNAVPEVRERDSHALWCERQTVQIDQLLLASTALSLVHAKPSLPVEVHQEKSEAASIAPQPTGISGTLFALESIPEIDFDS